MIDPREHEELAIAFRKEARIARSNLSVSCVVGLNRRRIYVSYESDAVDRRHNPSAYGAGTGIVPSRHDRTLERPTQLDHLPSFRGGLVAYSSAYAPWNPDSRR